MAEDASLQEITFVPNSIVISSFVLERGTAAKSDLS
jgi:hypothetical protein